MRHPDEGTIHAWLDGALPDADARGLEEHVAACPSCAAQVAEARGMVAGASRILAALDSAPAGVVPAGSAAARRARPHRAWWRRPGIGVAAAFGIIAVGTTWTLTRNWAYQPAVQYEAAAPPILRADDSSAAMERQSAPTPAEPKAPARAAAGSAGAPAPPLAAPSGLAAGAANRRARGASAGSAVADAAAARTETLEAAPERALLQDRIALTAEARHEEAAKAAESDAAARQRVRALGGELAESLRPAPAAPPAPPQVESRERAAADMAPLMSGRSLGRTARDLAGCYALELGQSRSGDAPQLPSVVRLAESLDEAANAYVAPTPAQGLRSATRPLLVPPAMDSEQFGWRVAMADSVSVRLASEGRTVLLVFPAATDPLRFGTASTAELPGIPSWRAALTVQRVPCLNR